MTDIDWNEIIDDCLRSAPAAQSVVYFVKTGRVPYVKIGYTNNLTRRLKEFETGSLAVKLIATIPGGQEEETKIHRRLASTRVRGTEFFDEDYVLSNFLTYVEAGDIEGAWRWLLEDSLPRKIKKQIEEERTRRVAQKRQSKAELDAYYRSLVDDRKRRLGW